jgi:hypothetical protein
MGKFDFKDQFIGLAFGLLMGIALVLGAWGSDASEMGKASAYLPWMRLVLGAALVIPLSGFVGWLVGKLDSAVMGMLFWFLVAVVFSFWAGHIPYEISSWWIGILLPDYKGLLIYPFGGSAETRLWLVLMVSGVLLVIGGALSTLIIDAARTAALGLKQFLILLLGVPLFLVAGIFSDMMIQRPLRQPLTEVNDLIQFTLDHEGQTLDKQTLREMHVGAVRSISALLHEPRQLALGDVDQDTLESARVFVDFDGNWARCWVIAGQPSFCQPSDELYGDGFRCLWDAYVLEIDECDVKMQDPAREWFSAWQAYPGDLGSLQPESRVTSQLGKITFLSVQIGQDTFECRLSNIPGLVLDVCTPMPLFAEPESSASLPVPAELESAAPTPLSQTLTTSTPSSANASLTQTPVPSLEAVQDQAVTDLQSQALLLAERKDDQTLSSLNLYTIELHIKDDRTFQGKMTLDYTNQEPVQMDSLVLRLFPNGGASYGNGSLKVSNLRVNGHAVETRLSLSDSVLEILLASPLQPGEVAKISLDFDGVVPQDYGGDDTSAYGLYNESDGVLALANWYPILAVFDTAGWHLNPASPVGDSVFSDMALYDVNISVPESQVLAATGVQIEQEPDGADIRYHYVSGPVRDFFIITSPDFEVSSQVVDGTLVNSYYLVGQEPGGVKALEVTGEALEAYNLNFGTYPYSELDVVDAPMRNAGGVEFPGIVLIESSRYDAPDSPVFINTVAHEVAHQWWYNVVGNDVINEPWIDEGLTTFTAGLYFQEAYGEAGYQGAISTWQQSYDKLVAQGKDDQVTRSLTYFENLPDPGIYGPVVYAKGALFFAGLRNEIGDRAFFTALQNYYQQFKYGIATGNDLLGAFEASSAQQLDEFFQQWLYSP